MKKATILAALILALALTAGCEKKEAAPVAPATTEQQAPAAPVAEGQAAPAVEDQAAPAVEGQAAPAPQAAEAK